MELTSNRFSPLPLLLAALLFTASPLPAFAQQPVLHVAQHQGATLYILGGTEVLDDSWYSEQVASTLAASDTLWLEAPPANPDQGVPPLREEVQPNENMHPVVIEEGYGNLSLGDYLDVASGERSVVESQRLGLEGINYRAMQPWLAFYTFSFAFWDKYDYVSPELKLIAEARANDVNVDSLFADRAAYYRFLGSMGDFPQTHYFQYMYNTFDWQRSGEYDSRLGWTEGNPDSQWLELISRQTPSYYRFMYQRRNPVMAQQLTEILSRGGTHFLYVDVNRTLGEESLLVALRELGVEVARL